MAEGYYVGSGFAPIRPLIAREPRSYKLADSISDLDRILFGGSGLNLSAWVQAKAEDDLLDATPNRQIHRISSTPPKYL